MEIVTLDEMKSYLKVDYDDDDELLISLLESANEMCLETFRSDDIFAFAQYPNSRIAIMYAVAFMYENRDKTDYRQLMMSLRSILSGIRKAIF